MTGRAARLAGAGQAARLVGALALLAVGASTGQPHGSCAEPEDSSGQDGSGQDLSSGPVLLQSRSVVESGVVASERTGPAAAPPPPGAAGAPPGPPCSRVPAEASPAVLAEAEPKTSVKCRSRVLASQLHPDEICPADCPFWAEEVGAGHACQFQCVTSSECGSIDPNATVADLDGMYCRACIVPGCEQCNTGGGDLCSKCREGYSFSKGRCLSPYRFCWYALYCVILLALGFLTWWYVDLRFKEITNESGLEQGLRFRSRSRLHRPKEGDAPRSLWPLNTNLLTTQVAGPGLALFFHFQVVFLGWALTMVFGWLLLAFSVSPDLIVLGTRSANTPQQLCSVTTWGYRTQHQLMWAKVGFMLTAYLGTFVGAITHAILQKRRFMEMDDEATMKDYAAIVTNLPKVPGGYEEAEAELSEGLVAATGEEIIGVSLCWDFSEKADNVVHIIEQDTERSQRSRASFSKISLPFAPTQQARGGDAAVGRDDCQERSSVSGSDRRGTAMFMPRSTFRALNETLGFKGEADGQPPSESESAMPPDMGLLVLSTRRRKIESMRERDLLQSIESTDKAFVVFRTEALRDKAVEACRCNGGLRLGDEDDEEASVCQLEAVTYEPETVQWANCRTSPGECLARLCLGILGIILALCLWTLCCYLPYALYVTSFSYARGERPSFLAGILATILVAIGNQIVYVLCRAVSEFARFKFQDTTEMTYLTLYFLACLVNLGMDMTVTFYTTYHMMVGMHAHTSSGQSLEELSWLQVFESYPMQRALGHFFFRYAFPSCFLIPFLLEPVFSIWLPGHIMELLVRSHSTVRGFEAERRLSYCSPMDLSRYSDILLNGTIAVLAFLFPGAYVVKMFAALFVSHVYIILLDHYKVLRAVPGFRFSTDACEQFVQALTAVPTGCLAAGLVLKYHALHPEDPRLPATHIFPRILAAFCVHLMVHWFLLIWLVPMFGRYHERAEVTYPEVARKIPCSWFSANPVHCLRSRYLHKDNPPCNFFIAGKEHLLRANPKIGVYFEDDAAAVSPVRDASGNLLVKWHMSRSGTQLFAENPAEHAAEHGGEQVGAEESANAAASRVAVDAEGLGALAPWAGKPGVAVEMATLPPK